MKVVVLGAGDVGWHIAGRLTREKVDVTLVDRDQARLDQATEVMDIQVICGQGADPGVLSSAGLAEADLLVAVTGNDETNILACRLAQLLASPETKRLARIRSSAFYDFFDEKRFQDDLGIDFLINPGFEAVETIMDFIKFPGAADVIEVAHGRLHLVGLRLPPGHPFLHKPLAKIHIENQPSLLLAAIHRHHQLLIPRGDTILKAGDLIYAAAADLDVDKVKAFFGLSMDPVRQVTIIGGGEVGYHLARRLTSDPRGFKVTLIEMNQRRCEYLSHRLPGAMIICGDGTDQDLLLDENVGETDAFIALSTDDEKNLISCLVAKRLGARQTITRVNRYSYAPLVSAIGLGAMVSARMAAARAVLKYLRRGRVISVAALISEDAEIIEFQVPSWSPLAGKRLMDVKFPAGALATALARGDEVNIPRGGTVVQAGDILAVVTRPEAISAVEKLLGAR
ncbi:MAG: Trk system potassium transporter TrkA [Candidatus Adiutrix sp.]|jgi:trk system potassium uptake protein TrkA|nr:Trk system potassium transporter TrkA [Candidatus Adiutrix sp.]